MTATWEVNPFTEEGCKRRPYFIPYPEDWGRERDVLPA